MRAAGKKFSEKAQKSPRARKSNRRTPAERYARTPKKGSSSAHKQRPRPKKVSKKPSRVHYICPCARKKVYILQNFGYTLGMKTNLIFVSGTMGAGKTATCRALRLLLPNNVFLDGDDCWNMHPFTVNDATKRMVLGNIAALLNNFLASGQFENILLCWVMHERAIVDEILGRLHGDFDFSLFTLTCEEGELRRRLQKDIATGLRDEGIIARSLERATHYKNMGAAVIDTTRLTPEETAQAIANALQKQNS